MTNTIETTGEIAKIIIHLEEIVNKRKELETEEAKLWKALNAEMDRVFGVPSIDEDENKFGGGKLRFGKTVLGRSVANYGSKIDPENLEKNLHILLREGVLDQKTFDKIISKREVKTVQIDINETELNAIATIDEEVRRAIKKSLTPPEVRVSKIAPKKATPEDY